MLTTHYKSRDRTVYTVVEGILHWHGLKPHSYQFGDINFGKFIRED